MKFILNISLIGLIALFSFACCSGENEEESSHDGMHENATKPTASTGNFGSIITAKNTVDAADLPALLEGHDKVEAKLSGNIDAVCQMSGCWMDVSIGNGETVHVTFKDDGFLMPKDAAGKTAIIEGVGTFEELPVSMLKHLAEDEGKSQEEIDAITEPKMEYTFVAHGVLIIDKDKPTI